MKQASLVIAPDYPPTNRISSLRAYYFAQALSDAGLAVDVLAEEPAAGQDGLPRDDHAVAVTRVHSVHRLSWLVRALWHVSMLAWRRRRFDLIVSTSGPFLSHVVGAFAKRLWPRASWAADYRDLWASGHYYGDAEDSGLGPSLRRWLERRVLAKADAITTVSRGLQQNLAGFHGREVLVFHNGFEPDAATESTSARAGDPIRICHTGFLYAERSPAAFLAALERARGAVASPVADIELILAGPVDREVGDVLARFADCARVRRLGTVPRAEAYRLQRDADYCLLLEDPQASRRGVLTGKIFEYIGMRKPVIAFGIAADSEAAEILAGAGLLAFRGSDPAELEAFLANLMRGVVPRRASTAPDEAVIARYDRRVVSRAFVEEILRSAGDEGMRK